MKERPILFSAPMVRAILEGRKTMTRRVIKGTALEWLAPDMFTPEFVANLENHLCPYGQPGDRLWVRETFAYGIGPKAIVYKANLAEDGYPYEPIAPGEVIKWTPSIFMPRRASRITLELTAVRVERVRDISEYDAGLEGAPCLSISKLNHPPIGLMQKIQAPEAFVYGFYDLWNSINDKRGYGWDANPWVWVVEFKRIEP